MDELRNLFIFDELPQYGQSEEHQVDHTLFQSIIQKMTRKDIIQVIQSLEQHQQLALANCLFRLGTTLEHRLIGLAVIVKEHDTTCLDYLFEPGSFRVELCKNASSLVVEAFDPAAPFVHKMFQLLVPSNHRSTRHAVFDVLSQVVEARPLHVDYIASKLAVVEQYDEYMLDIWRQLVKDASQQLCGEFLYSQLQFGGYQIIADNLSYMPLEYLMEQVLTGPITHPKMILMRCLIHARQEFAEMTDSAKLIDFDAGEDPMLLDAKFNTLMFLAPYYSRMGKSLFAGKLDTLWQSAQQLKMEHFYRDTMGAILQCLQYDVEAMKVVLSRLLLSCERKSESLYQFAEILFRCYHQKVGIIQVVESSPQQYDYVKAGDGQVVGLEFFWMALRTSDELVPAQVLVKVACCFQDYGQFLDNCLTQQQDSVVQKRLLAALKLLLENTNHSGGEDVEIFIRCVAYNMDKQSLHVSSNSTILQVKSDVMQLLQVECRIRMVCNGKELLDHQIVGQSDIKDNVVQVQVVPDQPAVKVVQQVDIMKSNHFQALFEMLSNKDEDVCQLAWLILQLIPPDYVLVNQVKAMDSHQFEQLMDSDKSPFQLQYILKLLHDELRVSKAQFVESGGRLAVESALLRNISQPKCLNQLLEIALTLDFVLSHELRYQLLKVVCLRDDSLVALQLGLKGSQDLMAEVPPLAALLLKHTDQDVDVHKSQMVKEFVFYYENLDNVSEFIDKLVDCVELIRDAQFTCYNYMTLLHKISSKTIIEEPLKLIRKLCRFLVQPTMYQEQSASEVDSYSSGLIAVSGMLLEKHQDLRQQVNQEFTLLSFLFHNCLFDIPKQLLSEGNVGPPRAKSGTFRNHCFSMLHVLVNGCPQLQQDLIILIQKQQSISYEHAGVFEYSPIEQSKAASGFVGLKNLGATCYMNSLLQQLYMIPQFRNGIFSAPSDDSKELLHKLRLLYANLSESQRRSYDTTDFTQACTDIEGNKMDVHVQMDVDEFFNVLFDRLETQLKGTPQEKLLDELFGGTLSQQIKSKDCNHISSRDESFFSVQCEVKNKKSVIESLEHYVVEEVLDGDNQYFCGECQKHVDAVKRMSIKKLPNILVLSLKRFDFDFNTMLRQKLNDYFQFPWMLNMEPFTLEYLESGAGPSSVVSETSRNINPAFAYKLSGVLIHTGTADSGHYYSVIRDRNSLMEDWYMFNDSAVDEFDKQTMPQEAFGGVSHRSVGKKYNAYMLFYEKVEFEPLQQVVVPQSLKSQIWQDNFCFYKDRSTFDVNYYRMVHQMVLIALESLDEGYVVRAGQVGVHFLCNVLLHSKDYQQAEELIQKLHTLFDKSAALCGWTLDMFSNDVTIGKDLMLDSYIHGVRVSISSLMYYAVAALRNHALKNKGSPQWIDTYGFEQLGLGQTITRKMSRSVDEVEFETVVGPSALKFMDSLMSYTSNIRLSWRSFAQYWSLVIALSHLGTEESHFFVRRGLIGILLSLIKDPTGKQTKTWPMKDRFNTVDLSQCYMLLSWLVQSCRLTPDDDGRPLLAQSDYAAIHSQRDDACEFIVDTESGPVGDAIVQMFVYMMMQDVTTYTIDLESCFDIIRTFQFNGHIGALMIIGQLIQKLPEQAITIFHMYTDTLKTVENTKQARHNWAMHFRKFILSSNVLQKYIKNNWQEELHHAFVLSDRQLRVVCEQLLAECVLCPAVELIKSGEASSADVETVSLIQDTLINELNDLDIRVNDQSNQGVDKHGKLFVQTFKLLEQSLYNAKVTVDVARKVLPLLIQFLESLGRFCGKDVIDYNTQQVLHLIRIMMETEPKLAVEISSKSNHWNILANYEFLFDATSPQTVESCNVQVPDWCFLVQLCLKQDASIADSVQQSDSFNYLITEFLFNIYATEDIPAVTAIVELLVCIRQIGKIPIKQLSGLLMHHSQMYKMDTVIQAHLLEIAIQSEQDIIKLFDTSFCFVLAALLNNLTTDDDVQSLQRLVPVCRVVLAHSQKSDQDVARVLATKKGLITAQQALVDALLGASLVSPDYDEMYKSLGSLSPQVSAPVL